MLGSCDRCHYFLILVSQIKIDPSKVKGWKMLEGVSRPNSSAKPTCRQGDHQSMLSTSRNEGPGMEKGVVTKCA